MSVHYTAPVWKLDLPTGAKIVLLKFGDNANDDGYAWPSLPRVAAETGLGLSTVRAKVARFRRHGVLILKKGGRGGRAAADYEDDSPGATCRYFIDLERAKDLYRAGGRGFDFEPETDPETVAETGAGDAANPPDAGGLEVIHTPPDDGANPPDDGANPPDASIPPTPPYMEEPSSEPSSKPRRARDAAAVDNSGDARAEPDPRIEPDPDPNPPEPPPQPEPPGPPPACAVWREAEARLRAVPAWALLCRAIPDADDGDVLTLAVEAPWVGYAILAWARGGAFGAEALVGRRIECRVRRWVQAALAERGQFTVGKPSLAAHRRDGETVRLDDAAWAAWAAARAEHPECAWLDCALPDDLEDGALLVRVGDARHMTQLLDGALETLAAAVGMAVKPRYGGDMDAALRAQREGDPLRVVGMDGDGSSSDLIRGPRVGTG
jgi:hypothetical protein